MGISLFGRSASTYEPPARIRESITLPNPNPNNYIIENHYQVGPNLVLILVYPDCTNYEGRKVLVYQNTKYDDILRQGSIDPHFCNNPAFKSPFARFEPTNEGIVAALDCATQFFKPAF